MATIAQRTQVVEDIVAPSVRRLAREVFDCGDLQRFLTRASVVRSDDRSRTREFDALYVGTRAVLDAAITFRTGRTERRRRLLVTTKSVAPGSAGRLVQARNPKPVYGRMCVCTAPRGEILWCPWSGPAVASDRTRLSCGSWRLVCGSSCPVEKSRLVMAYLAAHALADWGDEGASALPDEELRWARARLQEILQDPAQVQANFLDVVYGAHWMYAMVAEPADADAEALYEFMTREVERSHSPDYIMLALADWAQWEGLPSEALSWAKRAWREAQGPATRFERGTSYVHLLVQLAPDAKVPIEDTAIALFREASEAQDAFFLRTTRYMRRLETYLLEWNVDGVRAPSVARIRAEVMAICDSRAEDGPSRVTCRTFLAEQSSSEPPI